MTLKTKSCFISFLQEGLESRDRLVWMFDRVYNEETAGVLDFDQLEETLSILLEMEGVEHTKSKHKAREICEVAKKKKDFV